MKPWETSLRDVLEEMGDESREPEKGACPDEELLSLYVWEELSGSERTRLLDHFSRCSRCLDVVLLQTSLKERDGNHVHPAAVPQEALLKAKDIVASPISEAFFDLVIRCYHGSLNVLHSTLTPLPPLGEPAAAVLRRESKKTEPESIRTLKSFDSVSVEMECMPVGEQEGVWDIHFLIRNTDPGQTSGRFRVTLKTLEGQKELLSCAAKGGVAVFEKISSGDYGLEIKAAGHPIGELSVRLG